LASPDKTVVALLREERVRRDMQELIDTELVIPDAAVVLTPPGQEPPEPATFLTGASETFLPGWQLALNPKGPDPIAVAADRRIAIHLWTGVLVVVAFGTLSVLVARYVGMQIRLTRLKNDLLATVSHELKTPLSSIRALVETLLAGQDSQQRQEYLQLIAKENERLSRLIDNFLAFAAGAKQTVSAICGGGLAVIEAALRRSGKSSRVRVAGLKLSGPGTAFGAGDADA
jgi:signal transduction histidine kinase